MKITSLENQFIYSRDKTSQKLMIVLHGLGDSYNGYSWLPGHMNLPELNYLLVNAPEKYGDGFSWYEIPQGRITSRPTDLEIKTVERSRNLLYSLLEEVQEQGTSINDVFLLGFSQGCVMSLELALKYDKVFAGICGISGYLFNPNSIEDNLSEKAKLQNILITHGKYDEIVPYQRAEESVALLKNSGLKVNFQTYEKAHTIDAYGELTTIRDWIIKAL